MEIIILIFSVLILILLIYLLLRPQQDQNNALNEIRLELLKDQHESFQRLQNQTRADIHDAMQPVNEKMVMLQKEFNMTKAELQQDTQAGFSLMRSQLLDVLQKQMDLLETNNRQNEKVLKELQNVLIKDIFEQNQKASAALMAQIKDGLGIIQDQNTKKLQEMQSGINEKLSESLDKRLDDSFRQIGERLSSLYTSLGELRNLESGVQSLNRTLSNVKTRGIWGEMQLGNILADIFTPGQYEENVATRKKSSERVEYAVRIPDKEDPEHFFYLPIDSKFPADLFARIQDAAERADSDALKTAANELRQRIKSEAMSIRDKYITPPDTTDFAIMFLPTESLYAEVLRMDGLAEECQKKYKVILSGPTTLAALLNSLCIGFRYLSVNQKSEEIMRTLSAIKTQYGRFAELIGKTQKKLAEAQKNTEALMHRSDIIQKNLRRFDSMEITESAKVLGLSEETIRQDHDEDA